MNSALQKLIATVVTLRKAKSRNAYEFAEALFNVDQAINWRKTNWNSFSKFCETELQMPDATGYNALMAYKALNKFGYTQAEINQLLQKFSFTKAHSACNCQQRKIAVKSLIKKYKDLSSMQMRAMAENGNRSSTEKVFTFSLPEDYANKFEGILESHGMSINGNNRRSNVRNSMMNFLDTL